MFIFPLDKISVTSRFIIYAPFGKQTMHYGMDYGCATGTPVYASNSGTVCMSTYDSAGGNMIAINGDHELSRYAHLSKRLVSVGASVKMGDLIGYSGATGTACAGAHLHFETWLTPANYNYSYADKAKYAVDPMSVCHTTDKTVFNNNGLSTMKPIPQPEPTPESAELVNGTMKIIDGAVRFRLIPEVSNYQYIVGGYNRSADTFKAHFENGTYPITAVAKNDGYRWGLVTTSRGSFWVAEIDGKTKIEAETKTDIEPKEDAVNDEIAQLKMDLESCHLTIQKLRETIDNIATIASMAKYN